MEINSIRKKLGYRLKDGKLVLHSYQDRLCPYCGNRIAFTILTCGKCEVEQAAISGKLKVETERFVWAQFLDKNKVIEEPKYAPVQSNIRSGFHMSRVIVDRYKEVNDKLAPQLRGWVQRGAKGAFVIHKITDWAGSAIIKCAKKILKEQHNIGAKPGELMRIREDKEGRIWIHRR